MTTSDKDNLVYLVMQEVEHEGTDVKRAFDNMYDACGYALMLTETETYADDIRYTTVAYQIH